MHLVLHIYKLILINAHRRFPGYLDNSVAGGIPSGMGVFESLVRECMEEASIEADIVRKHTRAVGSISYFFRYEALHREIIRQLSCRLARTSKGWLQPEVE